MFTPPLFAETDDEVVADIVARARVGVMVTQGPEGLRATHLPFVHDRGRGVLLGHLAWPNPQAQDQGEAMIVFQATEAYVTPGWYPSKAEHGRHVPTWNYEAAHVYGGITWFSEPDRLMDLLERLTDRHETGRTEPWRVSDAPEDYIERLLRGIVGVEIAITRVEAKRKLSQNRDEADYAGVMAGLRATGDPRDAAVAAQMETLMPSGRAPG
jgi:transcriptional regulator